MLSLPSHPHSNLCPPTRSLHASAALRTQSFPNEAPSFPARLNRGLVSRLRAALANVPTRCSGTVTQSPISSPSCSSYKMRCKAAACRARARAPSRADEEKSQSSSRGNVDIGQCIFPRLPIRSCSPSRPGTTSSPGGIFLDQVSLQRHTISPSQRLGSSRRSAPSPSRGASKDDQHTFRNLVSLTT